MSQSPSITNTDLAVDRTWLAHNRTLMAWIRTSASLISFGFTIYKFFQFLRDQGGTIEGRAFGAPRFAMSLIALGLISLVVATYENQREMRALRKQFSHVPYSSATAVAGLVALLGIAAFLAVLFRQ